MSSNRKISRHIYDAHAKITTKEDQALCGRRREPREEFSITQRRGTFLKDFDDLVDKEPIDGESYCKSCKKMWRKLQ